METGRLVPFAGIAFVALILLAVLGMGGGAPASGAAAAEVASFYDEHAIRQFIAAFLLTASAPFLVLFGVSLARHQPGRDADGGSLWGHVVIAGSILAAGAILVTALVHLALVDGAEQISPAALQALNALDGNTWIAFFGGLGMMMLGAAGTLLSAGSRRWLGWTALVLGVALFVPFADFFAMMLTAIWIIVASVLLAGQDSRSAGGIAPSTA